MCVFVSMFVGVGGNMYIKYLLWVYIVVCE